MIWWSLASKAAHRAWMVHFGGCSALVGWFFAVFLIFWLWFWGFILPFAFHFLLHGFGRDRWRIGDSQQSCNKIVRKLLILFIFSIFLITVAVGILRIPSFFPFSLVSVPSFWLAEEFIAVLGESGDLTVRIARRVRANNWATFLILPYFLSMSWLHFMWVHEPSPIFFLFASDLACLFLENHDSFSKGSTANITQSRRADHAHLNALNASKSTTGAANLKKMTLPMTITAVHRIWYFGSSKSNSAIK